jgi:raffinose/stachyose/melibiose transport system substrate-binding protein
MLGAVQALYSVDAMTSLDQGLWAGSASLTDPTSVQVLNRVKDLFADAGPQFAGIAETDATTAFATGKAAMWPDGTWNAPTLTQTNPSLHYGYFPLPASDTAANNATLGGKLDFSFAVPSSSKNVDAAEKWLAFYAQKDNYTAFVKTSGFIPAEPGVAANPFVDSLSPLLGASGYTPAWDQIFHPNSRSGDLSTYPWAYPSITPLGKSTDMASLAGQMQDNWKSALGS